MVSLASAGRAHLTPFADVAHEASVLRGER
jgi:hypothetical protein